MGDFDNSLHFIEGGKKLSEEGKLNSKVDNKHVFGKHYRFSSDLSVLDQRAIATFRFSKLDCFHAQIFYPQIS